MARYNIWIEGYAVTGGSSGADLAAENIEGKDFNDAVNNWIKQKGPEWIEKHWGNHRVTNGQHYFWGCRAYPQEVDARKSFG